tara:strand:- start:211 stop:408 length:198 start_codon:yes stop_codon:yes gene_type:complete
MFRCFLLVLIFFSLSKGFTNGWLVINWSKFFYDIGFTSIDSNYPLNLSEFLKGILIKDNFNNKDY